jgi:hypothetical protein
MILHVMHYHDIAVDYMVGAQLEGFDTMVHLTEENDLLFWKEIEYLLLANYGNEKRTKTPTTFLSMVYNC